MPENVHTYKLSGVVRHQALPVAGATVSVCEMHGELPALASYDNAAASDNLVARVKTSAAGEFIFDLQPGVYRLEILPDITTRLLRHAVPEIEVAGDTAYNVNISTGSICNGVVRTISGTILRTGIVVAIGIESLYKAAARVDEQGRYAMTLPRGTYHVFFQASGSQVSEADWGATLPPAANEQFVAVGTASDACIFTTVNVMHLNSDVNYDLVLPDPVKFAVDVTDTFGAAVPGASVIINPSSADADSVLAEFQCRANVITNDQGKFALTLESGVFDIAISPPADKLLFALKDKQIIVRSDAHYSFQLAEGFHLNGRVFYLDRTLAQCLVRVSSLGKEADLMTKTDLLGNFQVDLPCGNYKVFISAHPKYAPTIDINGMPHVALAPWTEIVTVDGDVNMTARLKLGTALSGRILDESGQPRRSVPVSIFPESPGLRLQDEKMSHALASTTTDGEARFCFFLAPGLYWLVVHNDLVNAQKIEIGEEPVNIDVRWHAWCRLRLEVISEDGIAVPRCRVTYAPYGLAHEEPKPNGVRQNPLVGCVLTNENGVGYALLPSGVYSLNFSPLKESFYCDRSIRQLSIVADQVKVVKLKAAKPTDS